MQRSLLIYIFFSLYDFMSTDLILGVLRMILILLRRKWPFVINTNICSSLLKALRKSFFTSHFMTRAQISLV
jgi:hypothetical protein